VPNFVFFTAPIAELAHGVKIAYSINQSITHSPTLFDAPGTKAFALEYSSTHPFTSLLVKAWYYNSLLKETN